jgi:hypothetical protein
VQKILPVKRKRDGIRRKKATEIKIRPDENHMKVQTKSKTENLAIASNCCIYKSIGKKFIRKHL